MYRTERAQEFEVLLVGTFPVPSRLIERLGPRILLAQIDAKDGGKHVDTVEHHRSIVDEVDEIERASVLLHTQLLIIQVLDRITDAMHARADTIPSRQATIALLHESLLDK